MLHSSVRVGTTFLNARIESAGWRMAASSADFIDPDRWLEETSRKTAPFQLARWIAARHGTRPLPLGSVFRDSGGNACARPVPTAALIPLRAWLRDMVHRFWITEGRLANVVSRWSGALLRYVSWQVKLSLKRQLLHSRQQTVMPAACRRVSPSGAKVALSATGEQRHAADSMSKALRYQCK